MNMGPCPSCGRHVFIEANRCPFCGLTRRGFLGAAAGMLFVPDLVAAIQETKYGGPREADPRALETQWIWNRAYGDWRAGCGLNKSAESWASHKVGTIVAYSTNIQGPGKAKIGSTYKLTKVTEKEVTLLSEVTGAAKPLERTLARKPADAKWEAVGNETLEIDGKKFECEIKAAKIGAQEVKVWFVKDGWVKSVYGAETTQLLKHSEALTAGGKKYSCALWETINGAVTIREWRSTDVPGMLVRREEMIKRDPKAAAETTLTIELTSVAEGK